MSANEAPIRHLIDKALRDSGWQTLSESEDPNVVPEFPTETGPADYLLKDSKGFPLAVIEAKKEMGKGQYGVFTLMEKSKEGDMPKH